MSDDRLLRMADVARITTLSPSSIRRLVGRNQFPQPVRIADRSTRWWESAVRTWLKENAK